MSAHLLLAHNHVGCIVDVGVQRQYGVGFVVVYEAEHFLGSRRDDLQKDAGILHLKFRKTAGQQGIAEGIRHGQADGARGRPGGVDAVLHSLGQADDLMGVSQSLAALFRQGHGAVDPLKELGVQLAFQLFDLEGNRGLGKTQNLRGFCKASELRHMDKGGQILDIHRFSYLKIRLI